MRALLLLLGALAVLCALLLPPGPPRRGRVVFAEDRNSTVFYSSEEAPADLLAHGRGRRPKMVSQEEGPAGGMGGEVDREPRAQAHTIRREPCAFGSPQ